MGAFNLGPWEFYQGRTAGSVPGKPPRAVRPDRAPHSKAIAERRAPCCVAVLDRVPRLSDVGATTNFDKRLLKQPG
jgi:hypothetical protein